ncbi:ATP-dependent helicase [Nocardioides sp. CCNWLW239]|uniref:ATP-dependent helicase n=1 Tax=Nocardioides sp. CCNWLW239 TaxID=3128902 RepID=UPI003016F7BC
MTREVRDSPVHRGIPRQLAEGIENLDHHQRAALAADGNLVIVAGPGSGKTRTVVARAAYLLSIRISPLRGLATITYTNQAAAELKQGLASLGVIETRRLFAGTLHSFCLTQVLPYARLVGVELPALDAVMTASEEKALLEQVADDEGVNFYALKDIFTSLRRRIAAGEDVSAERPSNVAAVRRYEAECRRSQIWDFEGIVLAAVRLLDNHPDIASVVRARFPVVMVDEYQDLGAGLHRLVETLLQAGVEITAVGDADQSIYGWAGGDPAYLEALCARDDFTVRRLETNYRCGSAVVAAAELALTQQRGWKADPRRDDPGTVEFQVIPGHIDDQARAAAAAVLDMLAAGVAPHEVAVLLRYRAPLGPLIERLLVEEGVAVRPEGTPTAPSTEMGKWLEAAALYAVRMTPRSPHAGAPQVGAVALLRRFDSLTRAAGLPRARDPWVKRVVRLHSVLLAASPDPSSTVSSWASQLDNGLGLTELAVAVGDPRAVDELGALTSAPPELLLADLATDVTGTGKVVLATYHGSKGRTFTAVVLPGLTEGVVPPWGGKPWAPVPLQGPRLEEERRNFYVALTRSRGSVLLQPTSTGQNFRREITDFGYSSFVVELAASLGVTL